MNDEQNLPVMTRETRAAFYRGMEVAINACVLIVEHRQQKTSRDIVAAMRDLIVKNVPRAG